MKVDIYMLKAVYVCLRFYCKEIDKITFDLTFMCGQYSLNSNFQDYLFLTKIID